jgi:hypothetical protein
MLEQVQDEDDSPARGEEHPRLLDKDSTIPLLALPPKVTGLAPHCDGPDPFNQ